MSDLLRPLIPLTASLAICVVALAGTHGSSKPAASGHHVTASAGCTGTLADDKPLKALKEWLKNYRAGKIDVVSKQDQVRKSLAVKYGILEKDTHEIVTGRRDLELILVAVAELDNEAAAEQLLEVAAIGLDEGKLKYTYEMAPYAVRELGESQLGRLRSVEALDLITRMARGEAKADKAYGSGMRAAAVRMVGARKTDDSRKLLQDLTADGSLPVRLAAIESLGGEGHQSSAGVLAERLSVETEDSALTSIVRALHKCMQSMKPEPKEGQKPTLPQEARSAVLAAVGALGRATWRADMDIVSFLGDYRVKESIPALIALLQRYKDNPADVAAGKLSGLLQHRAHDTLVALTGAIYPADAPERWSEFWEREKDKLVVDATDPESRPQQVGVPGDSTAVREFFGIPVEGNRILFIVDLSGSMSFPMEDAAATTSSQGQPEIKTRLDYAKRQLTQTVDKLPEETLINFVTYNGNPKAKIWAKEMVEATRKNKDRARKFIAELRADGGTNMWAGLNEGLRMKSLVYGDRYESNVDELFIVSDGAPTVGDITDAEEIRRLVTETNRFSGVRINTIFLSSPEPPGTPQQQPPPTLPPADLMRLIAEQNGGKFLEVKG